MTQLAQVKKILSNGCAEVSVHRKTACSHDCSDCAGCELTVYQSDITITAENGMGARIGDTVLLESANSEIIYTAVLVYVVPFVLFFIGYFLSKAIRLSDGFSIISACICFAIGFLPARSLERTVREKKSVQFRIVEITKPCSDI